MVGRLDGAVKGALSNLRTGRRSPPPAIVRLVAASFAGAILFASAADSVCAQSGSRPAITVAPTLTAEPATASLFPIRIGPPEAVPANSFIRVRGLPPMAALSEGHSIAPGSWAVPIAVLSRLKLTLPADATGRSEVRIMLVGVDGTLLAEARSILVVGPRPAPASGQAKRNGDPPTTASILRAGAALPPAPEQADRNRVLPPSGPAPMTPEDRERAARLMKKGDDHLAEGNVAAARLFYERAADAGLAQAAMALAATFDAAELSRSSMRGIQPDAKEARRWYERARQLGAGDAEQRLRRLGVN